MELDFSEGFQTITGENGWGKSTMAAFIKAMLYGMEATARRSLLENERRHYQPWQGGAYGGSMEFTAGGKTYRAERTFEMCIRDRYVRIKTDYREILWIGTYL